MTEALAAPMLMASSNDEGIPRPLTEVPLSATNASSTSVFATPTLPSTSAAVPQSSAAAAPQSSTSSALPPASSSTSSSSQIFVQAPERCDKAKKRRKNENEDKSPLSKYVEHRRNVECSDPKLLKMEKAAKINLWILQAEEIKMRLIEAGVPLPKLVNLDDM